MYRYLIASLILCFISFTAISQSVYNTPSGKKYHLASCRMVENVSERISIEEALESGLEPCKICKPEIQSAKKSSPNKEQGQGSTVQCMGTTKAGTRCKHMTRIANGYCYQHQP